MRIFEAEEKLQGRGLGRPLSQRTAIVQNELTDGPEIFETQFKFFIVVETYSHKLDKLERT